MSIFTCVFIQFNQEETSAKQTSTSICKQLSGGCATITLAARLSQLVPFLRPRSKLAYSLFVVPFVVVVVVDLILFFALLPEASSNQLNHDRNGTAGRLKIGLPARLLPLCAGEKR